MTNNILERLSFREHLLAWTLARCALALKVSKSLHRSDNRGLRHGIQSFSGAKGYRGNAAERCDHGRGDASPLLRVQGLTPQKVAKECCDCRLKDH